MEKVFVAKIELEFEYQVDKNNYLEWESEYETENQVEPRSLDKLLFLLKNEFAEAFSNIEIQDIITIEEKGEN